MHNLKWLNWSVYMNIIILIMLAILAISLDNISIVFILNFILIGSLNFVILKRIRNSWTILKKLKDLKEVDFPKYKDISMVVLGSIFSIVTYMSLLLECFGVIDINKSIGNITFTPKMILFGILIIIAILAFLSAASGIIVTPCLNKGTEVFLVSENNITYGNETFNRATGSFKDGIIIGYYIFYFKDIHAKYKDKLGNIIIQGNNGHPFKIEISSKRSKKYFSKVLAI